MKKTNAQLALMYEDVLELITMVDAEDIEDEEVRMVVRAVLPLITFIERKLGEAVLAPEYMPNGFNQEGIGFREVPSEFVEGLTKP